MYIRYVCDSHEMPTACDVSSKILRFIVHSPSGDTRVCVCDRFTEDYVASFIYVVASEGFGTCVDAFNVVMFFSIRCEFFEYHSS